MCTKAEVDEVITNRVKPIEASIARIEKHLDEMPCQALMERIIRLEINHENLEKLRSTDKKDIDTLYGMSRVSETEIATLKEQNKGQDNTSSKTWTFILMGINFIFMLAMYFLTRG